MLHRIESGTARTFRGSLMASRYTSNARGQQQVWLPGLQVWAALGSRTDSSESPSSRTTAAQDRPSQAPSVATSMLQRSTAVNLSGPGPLKAAAVLTKATAQAESDVDGNVPHCPICKHQLQVCGKCWLFVLQITPQHCLQV